MAWSQDLSAELPIVDEDTVSRLRRLMADVCEGDEDLARDLLETFELDVERRLQAFQRALALQDRDEAAEAVHALKGASATVGAPRVSALCARLESALKEGADVEGASAALREEAAAAILALSAALQRTASD